MRHDILQWARQCQACATCKVTIHAKPTVLPILVPSERFGHVHVDIVGPFSSDQDLKYLLTMIDRTTRWPEVVPIADTTADTILQAFLGSWVSRFKIPLTVTSDRGAQFTSEAWKTSLGRLGINVSATTAYHPQANSIVEGFHRTLKNARCCAVRMSRSWTRSLPWVMLGLRNAPKLNTATSTAEVVFGTPLCVPGLCFQDEQSPRRSAAKQLELARSNASAFSPESLELRRFRSLQFVAKPLRTADFVYVRDDRLGKPSLAPQIHRPLQGKEERLGEQHLPLGPGQAGGHHIAHAIKGGLRSTGSDVTPLLGEGCCALRRQHGSFSTKIKLRRLNIAYPTSFLLFLLAVLFVYTILSRSNIYSSRLDLNISTYFPAVD